MNCAIRPMIISDYSSVLRLWQASEGIGLNESDKRENIALFLERNPGLSRVAADVTGILGAVLCGHDGRRGYLHHLAVAAARRRQGLGRRLVESCLADLSRQGILKCNIFLFGDNAAGEAFWRQLGWGKRPDLHMMQVALARRQPTGCC